MNLLKKIYRFIRFRNGFGVHSPFAFSFINDVVEERYGYYAYEQIAHVLKANHFNKLSKRRIKHNHLYYRIQNRFKPLTTLILGVSNVDAVLYMQNSLPNSKTYIFESDINRLGQIREFIVSNQQFELKASVSKQFMSAFEQIANKNEIGFLFISKTISLADKQMIINWCLKNKRDIIIVLEGLNESSALKKMWTSLLNNSQVVITFDLISIGIIINNHRLRKQNYKLSF